MRLTKLRIQNFRAFSDATINFDDYLCLVGPNGGGKSTVLNALNILFRNTAHPSLDALTLSKQDFFRNNTADPIIITATFGSLPPKAQDELKAYVRHGQLIFSAIAIWDERQQAAVVEQRGERLVMSDFKKYFEEDGTGAKAVDLKAIYQSLREQFSDLPQESTKASMTAALRAYEESHPGLCTLVPSNDQFYGWTKGYNLLSKYVQWVFVPAVKDATAEDTEASSRALKSLVARTAIAAAQFDEELEDIRTQAMSHYEELLERSQPQLDQLSQRLAARLREWSHPDAGLKVVWSQDRKKAVSLTTPVAAIRASESEFEADLSRFGHGLQRCYLLALLQELATSDDDDQPKLLLAVEEPELYQHPPQARHLSDVLERLSLQQCQVVVCTHSPLFVRGEHFSQVRCVSRRGEHGSVQVKAIDGAKIDAALAGAKSKKPQGTNALSLRLQKHLQPVLNEILFAPFVVLVEGIEDRAFLTTWMELTGKTDEFRRLGGHIVPCDAKSLMIEPLAILSQIGTTVYAIFDQDNDADEKHLEMHERDNTAIFHLLGHRDQQPFIDEGAVYSNCTAWPRNFAASIKESVGADKYRKAEEAVRSSHQLFTKEAQKSPLFIGLTLGELYNDGQRIAVLDDLCDAILKHGQPADAPYSLRSGSAGS